MQILGTASLPVWARARKVPQILFRPNWPAHNRRAPFLANDEMLAAKISGVILFGGGGIGCNLADKAAEKRLHVARIPKPETTRE